MIDYCDFCCYEHDDFHWRGRIEKGKMVSLCRKAFVTPPEPPTGGALTIEESRLNHWKDIKSRVTTHEGEFLTGERGREYQERWGKRQLGIDSQVNWDSPIYRKELEKRK